MRILRAAVYLTFPMMLGAMWIALNGGFGGHPEIAIAFTLISAIVAVVPEARRAGLVAVLFWGILASGAYALQKYIGPLGFAAFGMLTIAATAVISVPWSQRLLYPLAVIEAIWVGSFAHQTAYEFATVGHPTLKSDSCMTALMPAILGFVLTASWIAQGSSHSC